MNGRNTYFRLVDFINMDLQELIEINKLGAEPNQIKSFSGGNRLWNKQTDHWNRVAPHLFPVVGRLLNDSYEMDGTIYRLGQHGFARDREFTLIKGIQEEQVYELRADSQSMDVYPFNFAFRVGYKLVPDGLEISYETENLDDKTMPYSVGGHPAFQLEDSLENYYLEFDQKIDLDRHMLDGSYFSGEVKSYGHSNRLDLSDAIFENDAFVLKQPSCKSVSLMHSSGKLLVKMSCDSWTALGFWTKIGAPFLCIEPWWGWADHSNHSGKLIEKAGIRFLRPGEMEKVSYVISC